jgi:hypothetical protein
MTFHVFPLDWQGERLYDRGDADNNVIFGSESVAGKMTGGPLECLGQSFDESLVVRSRTYTGPWLWPYSIDNGRRLVNGWTVKSNEGTKEDK